MPDDCEATIRADVPRVPPLVCEPLPVERRDAWVNDPGLPGSRLALATCPDVGEPGWLTLYRFARHDIDAEREDRHLDAPWLQSDFHFVAAMLVTPDVRAELVRKLQPTNTTSTTGFRASSPTAPTSANSAAGAPGPTTRGGRSSPA